MHEMKLWVRKLRLVEIGVLFCLFASAPTAAQIVPDATLPVNSLVTPDGNSSIITGGTRAGSNLFHSFEQFSVPTRGAAYFNNAMDIQNIISRVTGESISNIDGLIRANGNTNLFLLNPNGIIFGSNAALNVGGSFLASTANSLNFADGTQFNVKSPQTTPLLTVSVPLGLQFGGNPGAIHVQDTGHNLIGSGASPVIRGSSSTTGLQVQPGNTLAIVGGDVTLDGGILAAEGGQIELGSVSSGLVSLSPTPQRWTLSYEGVQSFQDILLYRRALADASGAVGGSIEVQGRLVALRDGSVILIQNQGLLPAGTLSVNASESLEVSGTDPVARIIGGLRNETLGFGNGGEIVVSTAELVLQAGGAIGTRTYGAARAGNITVNSPESLQMIGASPIDFRAVSNITSLTVRSGQAGDIRVLTGQLIATGGGLLLSTTSGTGAGGDVTVDATNSVELTGVEPNFVTPSAISASTLNAGNAGSLIINTPRLVVKDGARVDSSTGASGSAGSVTINASESIEVSGAVPGSRNPSLVISSANTLDETSRRAFGLPTVLNGASGDVTINTGQLSVTNGAQVTVRNDGTGNAGKLQINADSVRLDNQAGITASTQSNQGGNISINLSDLLLLRDNSQISTSAGNAQAGGDGGKIDINTKLLVAVPQENSDIIANAFKGRGGNVNIVASSVFGIQLRNLETPQSDITASSRLGINGTVQINTLDIDPSSATAKPVEVAETPEVSSVCQRESAASEFVITGTGGIPPSPNDLLYSQRGWHDNSVPTELPPKSQEPERLTATEPTKIVEAQGWRQNPDGTITLTAEANTVAPHTSLSIPTCEQASSPRLINAAEENE